MTEYHVAHLTFESLPKGQVGYAFPTLKAASLFASRAVTSPKIPKAKVVDEAGKVVVEFLSAAKVTHTWVPSPVAKGYALIIT